ncbi:Asp23/Gls24 family envelope stress response protein [Microbacterium sp. cx-55]|uniref:Asp23/Gls24 family envelope stress response protein n=1 Tax=unclassified Microbacterium TaxID=2609290 RepID=UPI001CC0747D|nr:MULTISPECIES: Asp23/Gls24 family envelope stress response protein [unclassified Microbacterium]MBZ4487520.1 Asp23/Gls24 family envelope stress response protein [Microbacterium sp. cx-55]MCC4908342.1 Asp23/Gls24 family envelope stress response protein [Microbacterium sp. cx-59]UGB35540.1 Asp23/Gls24 family envelope stress response protein [Microbacterium sp. cx-55]
MATDDKTTTPTTGARVDRNPAASFGTSEVTAAGRTTIADGVVAKVAGIAAREVAGVYALGGGGTRALGAIRDAINATDLGQGVKVEVGETQAAADLTIVVEYPTPIQEVANNVRSAVANAISRLVGLEVVEVNVSVNDVHLPGDDSDDESDARVA